MKINNSNFCVFLKVQSLYWSSTVYLLGKLNLQAFKFHSLFIFWSHPVIHFKWSEIVTITHCYWYKTSCVWIYRFNETFQASFLCIFVPYHRCFISACAAWHHPSRKQSMWCPYWSVVCNISYQNRKHMLHFNFFFFCLKKSDSFILYCYINQSS